MTYPVVVFVIAILAVIGMLLFIVPVFVGLFAGFDAELPLRPASSCSSVRAHEVHGAARAHRRSSPSW